MCLYCGGQKTACASAFSPNSNLNHQAWQPGPYPLNHVTSLRILKTEHFTSSADSEELQSDNSCNGWMCRNRKSPSAPDIRIAVCFVMLFYPLLDVCPLKDLQKFLMFLFFFSYALTDSFFLSKPLLTSLLLNQKPKVCFYFFEVESHCIDQVTSNSQRSTCLCL